MAGRGELLDEAMGLFPWGDAALPSGRIVAIEDCVAASGAFLLHHFLKRTLSVGGTAIFLALAQPFSYYDRILRKMGCNITVWRNKEKLHFIDLLDFQGERCAGSPLSELYLKVQKVIDLCKLKDPNSECMIMIDDLSLLEVSVNGSAGDVLDFVHYCVTLTSMMGCSLILLNHEDIYSNDQDRALLLHLRYYADRVIKIGPLSTGWAADVHGEITVSRKKKQNNRNQSTRKVWNFHFQVKENGVDFFYPGSRIQ